jgi:hypothetical protein
MENSPSSKFIAINRRLRERAIQQGNAGQVARAERDIQRGLRTDAEHYHRIAAELENAEAFRELAELGGLP